MFNMAFLGDLHSMRIGVIRGVLVGAELMADCEFGVYRLNIEDSRFSG